MATDFIRVVRKHYCKGMSNEQKGFCSSKCLKYEKHTLSEIFVRSFCVCLGGAAGRTRTDTVSLPPDFESGASANFTTTANAIAKLYYHNREQFAIVERHIL